MQILHLNLQNWRNFLTVDVPIRQRMFIVGPNASGKSNLLDALRFLRDVSDAQGGLQRAVHKRGGVSQIRSLHARRQSNIVVKVEIETRSQTRWTYELGVGQDNQRRPIVKREVVHERETRILERPSKEDEDDPGRLAQTHLEQINANKPFREIAEFLAQVRYLHLVPQLVRDPDRSIGRTRDPYGGDFLEQVASAPKKTLQSRLRRIRDALRVAVPQLKELELFRDGRGVPHLRGLYEHWRPKAGWQQEDQLSDGTLRLLALLWSLLDGKAPLLLEEPELSLHAAVVRHIPQMMARVGRKSKRQVLLSTHSPDLLEDEGIAAEEILVLEPSQEGTTASLASDIAAIRALMEGGMTAGEAVLPRTAPRDASQLVLFGD